MSTAWFSLLLHEPDFFKWLGVFSHIPLAGSTVTAAWFGFFGAAVQLFFVVAESLGYHICASFDLCMGFTVEKWNAGDHYMVTALVQVLITLVFMSRDVMRLLADLSRKEIYILQPLPQNVLEMAPRQFATSGDVPTIQLYNFHDAMVRWQLLSLMVIRNFYPTQLYGLVASLVVSLLPILAYAFMYRRDVIRIARKNGISVVLDIFAFDYWFLAASFVFGGMGVAGFVLQSGLNSGWHSAWHIFAGLAIWSFIVAIHRGRRQEM